MTIPRILWAYWSGEPMSWLRRETLNTFRRHNPDWDVRLLLDADSYHRAAWWPDLPREMPPDARCDVIRWACLAAEGGVFTDLDVIYLRPIDGYLRPRFATTCDGGTPEGPGGPGRAFAIGVSWSPPGDPVLLGVLERAMDRARHWQPDSDHQRCGSALLAQEVYIVEIETGGGIVQGIPAEALYPQGFLRAQNKDVWRERAPAWGLDGLLGLHWGGGHTSARDAERTADEAWARSSKCAVARAWRRAMTGAE